MKTVLITGAGGSVGSVLAEYLRPKVQVIACGHSELDIADEKQVRYFIGAHKPDVIFNCAGFTRVDEAETQFELARRANAEGPEILSRVACEMKRKLVHLSTDYVFDGRKKAPYTTEDPVGPLSVYAKSKVDGELTVLKNGDRHLVVRVAWLFKTGGKTFLSKLKGLIMKEEHLQIADDREGPCTYIPDLAAALWRMAELDARGIYHFTNSGSCSWYSFAERLLAEAKRFQLPVKTRQLERITSKDFSSQALRPAYSVLDLSKTVDLLGKAPRHWKETLVDFLKE